MVRLLMEAGADARKGIYPTATRRRRWLWPGIASTRRL